MTRSYFDFRFRCFESQTKLVERPLPTPMFEMTFLPSPRIVSCTCAAAGSAMSKARPNAVEPMDWKDGSTGIVSRWPLAVARSERLTTYTPSLLSIHNGEHSYPRYQTP